MSNRWKVLVVINSVVIALLVLLGVGQQLYWLCYEHEMCQESVAEAETGVCQLEMDAPLEFHWYWVPEAQNGR